MPLQKRRRFLIRQKQKSEKVRKGWWREAREIKNFAENLLEKLDKIKTGQIKPSEREIEKINQELKKLSDWIYNFNVKLSNAKLAKDSHLFIDLNHFAKPAAIAVVGCSSIINRKFPEINLKIITLVKK